MSVSKLLLLFNNAYEFWLKYIDKSLEHKYTDALIIGSLHHTLVLEDHKLNEEYEIIDLPTYPKLADWQRVVGQLGGDTVGTIETLKDEYNFLLEESDKIIAKQSHLEIAKHTSFHALASVFAINYKVAMPLVSMLDKPYCYVERTFYGEIDGVKFQVRPDMLFDGDHDGEPYWIVVDLKTGETDQRHDFENSLTKYNYDVQQWIYTEILRQNGIHVRIFRFLVSGKKKTTKASYYDISYLAVEKAGERAKKMIEKYKYCIKNDIWESGTFDYKSGKFAYSTTINPKVYKQYEDYEMGIE